MTRPLALLIGGCLALTAAAVLVGLPAAAHFLAPHYSLGFADDYNLIAKNLLEGHGYRLHADMADTMMREPGYPLFLAALFAVLGYGIEAARIGNLALGAAAALVVASLARRVTRDETAALIAVAIFLLHPGTVIATARGGVELLFILACAGFLLLLQRAIESGRPGAYAAAGLALGAAVMVRSTPIVFPLLLLPYLVLSAPRGERARRLGLGALLVGAMILVMVPWIARNYALSGAFVPTGTVQGVALQEGQFTCERMPLGREFKRLQDEAADDRDRLAEAAGLRFRSGYYQYFYSPADELAYNRNLAQRALERYRDEPALLARCSAANLFNFWFLGKNGLATAINIAVQLPLLAMALAGGWLLLRRRVPAERWAPVALFAACLVAVHLPVIAHARHSMPLVPYLGMFAAVALAAAWRRRSERRTPPAAPVPA
ncbi:MAG TPA: glycosyltransferase family 39 protein [Burkholderiales bacterium]|nr:glycosyltransferase family 39 protein [Burkholderiales bacterium]